MIDNLGGISTDAVFRPDRIDVKIFLLDRAGNKLLWGQRVSAAQPGFIAPIEDFDTHLMVYSDENQNVYDGRLAHLRWNASIPDTPRMLLGYIPIELIKEDAERETNMGVIELTLITPKQGNFYARAENVQIYSH